MEKINEAFRTRLDFSFSTTMAWVYFLFVIAIIGIAIGLISKRVYYYE
jgi:ABC-type sugar transport system permease subunit